MIEPDVTGGERGGRDKRDAAFKLAMGGDGNENFAIPDSAPTASHFILQGWQLVPQCFDLPWETIGLPSIFAFCLMTMKNTGFRRNPGSGLPGLIVFKGKACLMAASDRDGLKSGGRIGDKPAGSNRLGGHFRSFGRG
jgi:hypothetical protein